MAGKETTRKSCAYRRPIRAATDSDASLIDGTASPPVAQPTPYGVTDTIEAPIAVGRQFSGRSRGSRLLEISRHSFLWAMVAFALAIYAGYLHLQIGDMRGVNGFLTAYNGLLRDAAEISCVQKNSVIEIAKINEWRIDDNTHEWRLDFGQSQESIDEIKKDPHSIRIYINPEMPFSKEPGVVFRFDSRGCLESRR